MKGQPNRLVISQKYLNQMNPKAKINSDLVDVFRPVRSLVVAPQKKLSSIKQDNTINIQVEELDSPFNIAVGPKNLDVKSNDHH